MQLFSVDQTKIRVRFIVVAPPPRQASQKKYHNRYWKFPGVPSAEVRPLFMKKREKLKMYPILIFLVQWFSILTMSSFLAFIAISLKFVCRTESMRQRSHWVGHKNGQKTPFLWQTDDSFVALTQCDKQCSKERATNAKKKQGQNWKSLY